MLVCPNIYGSSHACLSCNDISSPLEGAASPWMVERLLLQEYTSVSRWRCSPALGAKDSRCTGSDGAAAPPEAALPLWTWPWTQQHMKEGKKTRNTENRPNKLKKRGTIIIILIISQSRFKGTEVSRKKWPILFKVDFLGVCVPVHLSELG